MKTTKGFTLIELLAIIVLLGLITLIITPKITSVLKKQKMNIFKDSVEGMVKAVKEDAVNSAGFNSTTSVSNYRAYTYEDGELYLSVDGKQSTEKTIKVSGKIENGQGNIVVTDNSDIVLAIYNDKFCAKKSAEDQNITVEDFSGSCVNDEMDIPEVPSCYTYSDNGDNTVTITGYDYTNSACSKDLVIPNRINGKKVSKLAPFAFVNAEVKIVEYLENDINGNSYSYDEYLANFPSDKEAKYIITLNATAVTGKICYTDSMGEVSVPVDINYVHTSGDGYYGCHFQIPRSPNDGIVNNYKFNSIDFSHATALTKIPIGLIAFSTVKSVNIGDYITEIDTMAFSKNFITNLIIPKSVTTINSFAFQENQINNVNFSNSLNLKTIKDGAFCQNNISTVNIQNLSNLEFIGGGWWGSFEDNSITSVTLKNLPNLTALGDLKEEYGPFNYNSVNTVVLDNLPKLELIGNNSFAGNNIDTIDIPASVKIIGNNAFEENSLTDLVLSNNITSIGSNAFSENSLSSIKFSNSMTSISDGAFNKNALTSLTIPSNITSIGSNAFSENSLTSVVIPNTVISIGNEAFYKNVIASIAIPNSVTSIGISAFQYNNIIQGNATIDNTTAGVTIGATAFDNNGSDKLTIITPVFLR